MRNVKKHRVSKPTPRNRVSVLFVFSIALMLSVIGSSAWVYLNHDGDFSPEIVSAVAAIDAPIVLSDPVVSVAEKPVAEEQEETTNIDGKNEITQQQAASAVAQKEEPTPAPETESIEKSSEDDVEVVTATTPPVQETASKDPEPVIIASNEPTTEEVTTVIEDSKNSADAVKITENPVTTDDTSEIASAETEQPKIPATAREETPSISATEMQEILTVEPAAGRPVSSSDKSQPDKNVTKSPAASSDKSTPLTASPKLTVNEPESTEPIEITKQDTQLSEPTPAKSVEPEVSSEIVVASLEPATDQSTKMVEEIQPDTPAWLDESPSLPVQGAVEMALVLPPLPPYYTILIPEVPVIQNTVPAVPAQKKETPSVEPVVLTVPAANKPLWQQNAQPFEDAENRPRIALIISEMGISNAGTTAAIDQLPAAVTFAFNPYGQRLQGWIDKSREKGHEVLLQLPMEPMSYPRADPGPRALLTSLTPEENFERLNWSLGRFTGYTGLTNQMGSKFTASRPHIEPILAILKEKGLLYVDSRTASNSVAAKVAQELAIPVALNNRFLDHRANAEALDARLKELEEIALKTGSAIGIGYPYPATFERLADWTASLARKGIVLAPISALVNRQDIR